MGERGPLRWKEEYPKTTSYFGVSLESYLLHEKDIFWGRHNHRWITIQQINATRTIKKRTSWEKGKGELFHPVKDGCLASGEGQGRGGRKGMEQG